MHFIVSHIQLFMHLSVLSGPSVLTYCCFVGEENAFGILSAIRRGAKKGENIYASFQTLCIGSPGN